MRRKTTILPAVLAAVLLAPGTTRAQVGSPRLDLPPINGGGAAPGAGGGGLVSPVPVPGQSTGAGGATFLAQTGGLHQRLSAAQEVRSRAAGTCLVPTAEACAEGSRLGAACLVAHPTECKALLTAPGGAAAPGGPWDTQVAGLASEGNTVVPRAGSIGAGAPDQLAIRRDGRRVEGEARPAPRTTGGGGNTMSLALASGEFRANEARLIPGALTSSAAVSAIQAVTEWNARTGYGSCLEYAYKQQPALGAFEAGIQPALDRPGTLVDVIQQPPLAGYAAVLGAPAPVNPGRSRNALIWLSARLDYLELAYAFGSLPEDLFSEVYYLEAWAREPGAGGTAERYTAAQQAEVRDLLQPAASTGRRYADAYLEEARAAQQELLGLVTSVEGYYSRWRQDTSYCDRYSFQERRDNDCGLDLYPWEVASELTAVNTRIVDLLRKLRTLGCLSPDLNACDWSPSYSVDTVNAALKDERGARELLNAMCRKVAVSEPVPGGKPWQTQLAPVAPFARRVYQQPGWYPYDNAQWLTAQPGAAESFDQFLLETVFYRVWLQQQKLAVSAASQYPDPGGSGCKLVGARRNASDGKYFDLFGGETGAGYSYDLGWWVDGYSENDPCDATMNASATFDAGAKMMGATLSGAGLHFGADLHASRAGGVRGSVSGRWGGTEIIPSMDWASDVPQEDRRLADMPMNVWTLTPPVVVMIGPVPITISAFAGLDGGYAIGVAATHGATTCQASTGDEPDLTRDFDLGVAFNVTPWASLYVGAEAALSAGFISAGVRGQVELLRVGVPLTLATALRSHPEQPERFLTLTTEGTLDLELSSLSGKVGAFVEIDAVFASKSWEFTFFEWAGPSTRLTLLRAAEEFPLDVSGPLCEGT
jgi:hypothetical protein